MEVGSPFSLRRSEANKFFAQVHEIVQLKLNSSICLILLQESRRWIEEVLEIKLSEEDFAVNVIQMAKLIIKKSDLKNDVILCQLMLKIKPGAKHLRSY